MTTTLNRENAHKPAEYQDLLRRNFLAPGKKVYVLLTKFSKTSLTRYYDVYVVQDGDRIERVTALVAWATGYRYDLRAEAIRTQNDGLDIVRHLARVLYGDERSLDGRRM